MKLVDRQQERPAPPRAEPANRGFDDDISVARLVARYAAASVVALIVVAVAMAFVSRRLGTLEAIEEAERVATLTAGAAVEPVLTDGILTGEAGSLATVDRAVRTQVLGGSLVRVKIWSADGAILYSDESRLIGDRFELDEGAMEVLESGEPRGELSDLSDPENRYEEPALELFEVYVPIQTPDGTPLLFEAYFRYNGVAAAGREVWLRFAPISLGSLLLLELLLVPLAISLARRLRRTQRQREQLLRSAIEAADAERRRIARDLHDGVVQDLAGVTFSLGAAARTADGAGSNSAEIREAADRVRDAVRSLRSLLVEIYPPNLYEEGLSQALSDLMARLEPRGIQTTLSVDPEVAALDLEATQLLYRAAQEALRNVVAHADASRVDVRVTSDDHRTALEVADDGRGIAPEDVTEREGHFGLRTLADLARALGGSMTIDSVPGRGTTVRVEVPSR